ncbi:MAG TPA: histidine kinase dimerization/phospho-acceptor domain-containing protein [Gaiellaceae bacterium]
MTENPSFPRLVSLAAHDLRTPLATVSGFAKTLARMSELQDPADRYVQMIEAASGQLAELLDELGLAARIEAGRYSPALREVDTRELAAAAAERLGADRVRASGTGTPVRIDPDATKRAVSALTRCALRHGGLDEVEVIAAGAELLIQPITPSAAPVVLGEELRDLGAAVAGRLVGALGGSLELDGDSLRVRLPDSP